MIRSGEKHKGLEVKNDVGGIRMILKYAIYQMDIVPGNPSKNRAKVKEWMKREVAKNKPDVVVLPEMWTTAYTLPSLDEQADIGGEPTKGFLQNLALSLNVNIIGGSVANKVNDCFYNTSFIIDRNGVVVYQYNKVHLVPMLDEHKYLTGGQKPPTVFELEGVKMGVIICYDLRFPEVIRSLALEGVEILHVVAEWPEARAAHWRILQLARAIENQMYVVSANRVGEYNNILFCGKSMVIDPWGEIVVEGSRYSEDSFCTQIDASTVPQVRKDIPVFESRVPHLYKKLF